MEETTEKTKKKSNKNWWILLFILIGVILIVVFIIWLLMQGGVKTTGSYPEDETPETLKCVGKNIPYKFFLKDVPSNAEIKVNAIFTKSKIDSISLVHRTTYDNEDNARVNSNIHEGDMNRNFQNEGMGPYALNASYALEKNVAQMSIYAKSSELSDKSIKYFMLDNLPDNLNGYKRGYTAQGFTCEVTK